VAHSAAIAAAGIASHGRKTDDRRTFAVGGVPVVCVAADGPAARKSAECAALFRPTAANIRSASCLSWRYATIVADASRQMPKGKTA
jgi:hypothetical protein